MDSFIKVAEIKILASQSKEDVINMFKANGYKIVRDPEFWNEFDVVTELVEKKKEE